MPNNNRIFKACDKSKNLLPGSTTSGKTANELTVVKIDSYYIWAHTEATRSCAG